MVRSFRVRLELEVLVVEPVAQLLTFRGEVTRVLRGGLGLERDLLDQYRAALELPADEIPTAEEVWLRYRASVAHGLAIWMATLSGGDAWQRPDICLAFAQRYSAAFIDLDTPAALNAIDA